LDLAGLPDDPTRLSGDHFQRMSRRATGVSRLAGVPHHPWAEAVHGPWPARLPPMDPELSGSLKPRLQPRISLNRKYNPHYAKRRPSWCFFNQLVGGSQLVAWWLINGRFVDARKRCSSTFLLTGRSRSAGFTHPLPPVAAATTALPDKICRSALSSGQAPYTYRF